MIHVMCLLYMNINAAQLMTIYIHLSSQLGHATFFLCGVSNNCFYLNHESAQDE